MYGYIYIFQVVVLRVANIYDSKSAMNVISRHKDRFGRTIKKFSGVGYFVELIDYVGRVCDWEIDVDLRIINQVFFNAYPKQWIAEPIYYWFEGHRISTEAIESPRKQVK